MTRPRLSRPCAGACPECGLSSRRCVQSRTSPSTAASTSTSGDCPRGFGRTSVATGDSAMQLAGLAFEFVDGPAAWRELDRFVALEASGWKGREKSAIGSSSGTLEYYRSLTRALSARGWLEFGFLRAEGRLLAAEINVRFAGVVHGLKCAYDESFEDYSPGNILLERSVQRAFESGMDELNAGSDHPWTHSWGMQQRPCWNVRLFPRSPLSLLLGYLPARLRRSLQRRRFQRPTRRTRETRGRAPSDRPGATGPRTPRRPGSAGTCRTSPRGAAAARRGARAFRCATGRGSRRGSGPSRWASSGT